MEEEKGFLARQKVEWRTLIFRAPSRRRWGLVGLVAPFGMIYSASPPRPPGPVLRAYRLSASSKG